MKSILRSLLLLPFLLGSLAGSLAAQNYVYGVTTLVAPNTHFVDDGICLDEAGNLYGSYWGVWQGAVGTHVGRLRPDGTRDTLATGFNHPNGLNYHDGTLYLANSGQSQVIAIDTGGTQQVLASVPGVSNVMPVPGQEDSLVAVAWQSSRLFGIRNGQVTTLSTGGPISGPAGMAYDDNGELYVGNFNNGRILHYAGNGQFDVLTDIGGGIGFITYSDGAILATNHTDKRVYRINLSDTSVQVIAGSGQAVIADGIGTNASFSSPNGIVATPTGDTIYVSEFMGKSVRMIVRIPATLSTSPSLYSDIKVYPVPVQHQLRLEAPWLEEMKTLRVFDGSGKLVSETTEWKAGIDTTKWSAGMYLLVGEGRNGEILFRKMVPRTL